MEASLAIALGASTLLAAGGFWFAATMGPRFGQRQELARAISVMLLALPGIALYRVSNALSRGMAVMHHDIYSRGLTESLGTAAALLLVLALGSRALAPEIAAIGGTLGAGPVRFSRPRPACAAGRGAGRKRQRDLPALVRGSSPLGVSDRLSLGGMGS